MILHLRFILLACAFTFVHGTVNAQSVEMVIPEIDSYEPLIHSFDRTGRFFITSNDSIAVVRDSRTGAIVDQYYYQGTTVAQFSPHGDELLLIGEYSSSVWNLKTHIKVRDYEIGKPSYETIRGVGYSPDGNYILGKNVWDGVSVYSKTGRVLWKRSFGSDEDGLRSIFYLSDRDRVGFVADSTFVICDIQNGKVSVQGEKFGTHDLQVDYLSHDSLYFVSARDPILGDSVFAFSKRTNVCVYSFHGSLGERQDFYDSKSNRILAFRNTEILIISGSDGHVMNAIDCHIYLYDVSFSPNKEYILGVGFQDQNGWGFAECIELNSVSLNILAHYVFDSSSYEYLECPPFYSPDSKRLLVPTWDKIICLEARSLSFLFECYDRCLLETKMHLEHPDFVILETDSSITILNRRGLTIEGVIEAPYTDTLEDGKIVDSKYEMVVVCIDTIMDRMITFFPDADLLTTWDLVTLKIVEQIPLETETYRRFIGWYGSAFHTTYSYTPNEVIKTVDYSDSYRLIHVYNALTGEIAERLEDTVSNSMFYGYYNVKKKSDCIFINRDSSSSMHNFSTNVSITFVFDDTLGRPYGVFLVNDSTVLAGYEAPRFGYNYVKVDLFSGDTLEQFFDVNEILTCYTEGDSTYYIKSASRTYKESYNDSHVQQISTTGAWRAFTDPNLIYLCLYSGNGASEIIHLETGKSLAIINGLVTFSSDSRFIYSTNAFGGIDVARIDLTVQSHPVPEWKIKWRSLFTREDDLIQDTIFKPQATISDPVSIYLFEDNDYLVVNKDNEYLGSPGATQKVAFSRDNVVVEFDQIDLIKNRPDKVSSDIGKLFGQPDSVQISAYHQAWIKRVARAKIDTNVTGLDFNNTVVASILTEPEYFQSDSTVQLQIRAVDPLYPLLSINIWVNDCPLYGISGISFAQRNINKFDSLFSIELSKGLNKIEISARNEMGVESYRTSTYVQYNPPINVAPKTYFIGIGVDHFADPKYNLTWSSKDIRDMCTAMKEKCDTNFILVDTLFNQNVTVENVQALKAKLMNTTVNDRVIIAYSGHGLLSDNYDYYLSTYNVNFHKPEENGLAYEELENLVDSIPARQKLMLIDACHSGEVDKEEMLKLKKAESDTSLHLVTNGKGFEVDTPDSSATKLGAQNSFELMSTLFVNVSRGTGTTVIAAASGTQFAYENGTLKNGVFTYCFLETMRTEKTCTVQQMKTKVSTRVTTLTNGLQRPTSRTETSGYDWVLW